MDPRILRCFERDRGVLSGRFAVRAVVLALAVVAAWALGHWSAWIVLGVLALLVAVGSLADLAWSARRRRARAALDADGNALAALHVGPDASEVELWLRDGQNSAGRVARGVAEEAAQAATEQGTHVSRSSEEREAVARWAESLALVADVEEVLTTSALGAVASEGFGSFAERWRALPIGHAAPVTEDVMRHLRELWVQARAAGELQRATGDAADPGFVRAVASAQVLLEGALERTCKTEPEPPSD